MVDFGPNIYPQWGKGSVPSVEEWQRLFSLKLDNDRLISALANALSGASSSDMNALVAALIPDVTAGITASGNIVTKTALANALEGYQPAGSYVAQSALASSLANYATTTSLTSEVQRAQQAEATLQNSIATLEQSLANSISGVPIGVPIPWPSNTIPSNAQIMMGQSFSAASNPQLAIMYPGLVIPDTRGLFIRGLDTTGNVDPNGPSRAILSFEAGTNIFTPSAGYPFAPINGVNWGDGNVDYAPPSASSTGQIVPVQPASGTYAIAAYTRSNGQQSPASWGTTRPNNIAFNYIVRVI